jgi:methionine transaminase
MLADQGAGLITCAFFFPWVKASGIMLHQCPFTNAMNITTKLPKVETTIFTVMSQLAMEHQAVNLGQGFPDFDVPKRLVDELSKAMQQGKNQYAPMMGILPLREAIAEKTLACYGASVNPNTEITVTSGASEAIFNAVLAVVKPGDEVIVLDPCYDCYEPAIDLAGAKTVHVSLDPQTFAIDWNKLRAAINPRTRMLFINSPHNPSGAMMSAHDMQTLADVVRDTNIIVLSDEVYEHIIFDHARHESVLRYPELAMRSFVISSFGKTYHCTGWKVGYCIAPPALTKEFRKVHQYNTRFKPLAVPGGYFQLVDYSAISDLPDMEFCYWLTKEKGITAIPLSPFYEIPSPGQRLIRLCFAKNQATLDAAIEKLVNV